MSRVISSMQSTVVFNWEGIMLTVKSEALASFLISKSFVGRHCSVIFDKVNMVVSYIIQDNVTVHELIEVNPKSMSFSEGDSIGFAFVITEIPMFLTENSTVQLSYNSNTNIIEFQIEKPSFTALVKGDDLISDSIDYKDMDFKSMKPYAPIVKAVKSMKGLSQELALPITVEMDTKYWCVTLPQACLFGAGAGIIGSMSSQLFEEIFDWDADVAQPTPTSIVTKKVIDNRTYLISAPISSSLDMVKDLADYVSDIDVKVCNSEITNDVSQLIRNMIANVKKKTVSLTFSPGRLDLTYNANSINLTTISKELDKQNSVCINVSVRTLSCITSIMVGSTEIMRSGDNICLLNLNQGLLLSGIIY